MQKLNHCKGGRRMATEFHNPGAEYHGYNTHTIEIVHSEKYEELYDAIIIDQHVILVGWCVWYRSKEKVLNDAKSIIDLRIRDRVNRGPIYCIVANEQEGELA